jgi:hypothetical protein
VQQAVPGTSRKGRGKPISQRIGQERRVLFGAELEMPLGRQLYGEVHAARLPSGMWKALFIPICRFISSLDLIDTLSKSFSNNLSCTMRYFLNRFRHALKISA